ncbi:DUF4357 domain-containing protein [Dactylosporangium sp. NPDC000521]|uniref:DUF4357 domain-containing protein n=1 Tax=Dactylosporangium sp. NPDC000521 TaxID=3363975 RepID=UPI0036A16345
MSYLVARLTIDSSEKGAHLPKRAVRLLNEARQPRHPRPSSPQRAQHLPFAGRSPSQGHDREPARSGTRPQPARLIETSQRPDGHRLHQVRSRGTFTSPSKAATAVTGSQINGWTSWHRESDGRTLDQLREDLDAADHE